MTPIVVEPGAGPALTAITLDPPAVAGGRVSLNLNSGTLRLRPDGPDWGESTVEAQMAQGNFGATPLGDPDVPNRQVTIPLALGMDGGAGYAQAKKALQAKVALFQTKGGWVQRDVDGLYGDVVGASLKLADKYSHLEVNEADLVLEVLPDWYGDEVALDPIVSTGPELVGVLKRGGVPAVIDGDYPARCRVEVDNGSATDQLGLLFGLRCRHYSSAITAALAYAAQSLTPLDTAANATVAGVACVRHQNLSTSWTPVLGSNLTAGTFLTHTGSYRVWARVYSTSVVPPSVRLVYDVGDLTLPAENQPVAIPGASNFYFVDLGEIRLDRGPGVHRWQGQMQAKGAAGAENVSIHRLVLVPLDEAAGRLATPMRFPAGVSNIYGRDDFTAIDAGAPLNARVAPAGGTWATAGAATDFAAATTSKTEMRATTGDGTGTGRRAVLGSTSYTDIKVEVDWYSSGTPQTSNEVSGLLARYIDANNFVYAYVDKGAGSLVALRAKVAGSDTILAQRDFTWLKDTWYRLRLAVYATGDAHFEVLTQADQPLISIPGSSTALATGGALATGKPGFFDTGLYGAGTRYYDRFTAVKAGPLDAVLYAGRSAELAWDGLNRKNSTGIAFGPVSHTSGDLPRLPPSGLEGRPVELFLKGTRGDLDQLPDPSASDGLTARVFVRPTFLAP